MIHIRKRADDFSDRHEYLGASEVGQALGLVDTYGTAKELWEQKTMRRARTKHLRIFDRGHHMECVIIDELIAAGCEIGNHQAEASTKEREWLVSHLDGTINVENIDLGVVGGLVPAYATGVGVLEIKAPGSNMARRFNEEGVHEHYIAQMQVSLHNTDLKWGLFAYMDYDAWEVRTIFVERNDFLIDAMLPVLSTFWGHVVADTWDAGQPEPKLVIKNPQQKVAYDVHDKELADDYLSALERQYAVEQEIEQIRATVTTLLIDGGYDSVEVDSRVKATKVVSNGRMSYKGKDLHKWTEELCRAIAHDERNRVLKMVEVFMTDPDLFISYGKPSTSYRFTPAKYKGE